MPAGADDVASGWLKAEAVNFSYSFESLLSLCKINAMNSSFLCKTVAWFVSV